MLVIVAMEIAEMSVWQYTRAPLGEELHLEQTSQQVDAPPITVIVKRNIAPHPSQEYYLKNPRWPEPDLKGNSARYGFARGIAGTQFYTGLDRLGIPYIVLISK